MRVLILGGYGVFGKRIAAALSHEVEISLIIAGRNFSKAEALAASLNAEAIAIDIRQGLDTLLTQIKPKLVINCCGPFQENTFQVLDSCIRKGVHYIDLADGRDYVARFVQKDIEARAAGIIAFTGASTVPAISSAILESFLATGFQEIHAVDYGVTPGNRTERGLATVAAILSYVGKPFVTRIRGQDSRIFGWQDLHRESYPEIGKCWMSNCDIPDLDIFPERYPALHTLQFYAGLELSVLHVGLWLLSWPVRWKLLRSLAPYARILRKVSLCFYHFGSNNGGMHVRVEGLDIQGKPKKCVWYLIAKAGDGPQVPATPAVILAKRIVRKELTEPGAAPAVGVITKDMLLAEWQNLHIHEVSYDLPI